MGTQKAARKAQTGALHLPLYYEHPPATARFHEVTDKCPTRNAEAFIVERKRSVHSGSRAHPPFEGCPKQMSGVGPWASRQPH